MFGHAAMALKKFLKLTEVGRLAAIILGAVSGAIGSILAQFMAWLILDGSIKEYWALFFPSVFSGLICGLICRKEISRK